MARFNLDKMRMAEASKPAYTVLINALKDAASKKQPIILDDLTTLPEGKGIIRDKRHVIDLIKVLDRYGVVKWDWVEAVSTNGHNINVKGYYWRRSPSNKAAKSATPRKKYKARQKPYQTKPVDVGNAPVAPKPLRGFAVTVEGRVFLFDNLAPDDVVKIERQ
jgi:hypothetical protein